ncbi:hypothetical protein CCAX7_15510 [Capsulimonas corticalis]|uniref:Uncharacterized protein n=1 Tax=Capsulimonas corticalis TaxID=2219043 RepID=A0A402CZ58_9BACT|nr:glycosyl hydrolase [Capsulimonas corticalis]BDI29500.1 hypothetical protein CCAX7_15510 [Capsulimonas corticalis]
MSIRFRGRALFCLPILLLAGLTATPTPAGAAGANAVSAADFLNSLGVNSAISGRGESLSKTIDCAKYLGIRWFRSGTEGDIPLQDLIALHKETGARLSWGLLSGGSDIPKLIQTAKPLAAAGALLALEGPNEPNNWGVTYQGEAGGKNLTWVPVAKLQSGLYKAVKSDPVLKKYPVWSISENGAETDNVGLQFLAIPKGAGAVMPDGAKYADFANVHNYIYHPNSPGLADNKTWNAADPTQTCKVDGLYGEYGLTWGRHFPGYSEADLISLPRVTTETGCMIDGPVTEEIHARNLLSMYLDQFKRGWSYTAVYLLRDRVDEAGNQQFGFYKPDYSPRKAAVYLHNLTAILADNGAARKPGKLGYAIPDEPATVHDLLLQKSGGAWELIVWGEQIEGASSVTVHLGGVYGLVKVYDPTVGADPVLTYHQINAVPLTLSDHPLIVEIPASRHA